MGRRIRIFRAETGKEIVGNGQQRGLGSGRDGGEDIPYQYDENDAVLLSSLERLCQEIFASTGIPPESQILLTGIGGTVTTETLVEAAATPEAQMDIYVFDRSLLTQSFASGVIADPAAHVATLSADLEDEDRDDVIELPNLQALASTTLLSIRSGSFQEQRERYIEAFRTNVAFSQSLHQTTILVAKQLAKLFHEQSHQLCALVSVQKSLQSLTHSIVDTFADIYTSLYEKEWMKQEAALNSFESDLWVLQHIPVWMEVDDVDVEDANGHHMQEQATIPAQKILRTNTGDDEDVEQPYPPPLIVPTTMTEVAKSFNDLSIGKRRDVEDDEDILSGDDEPEESEIISTPKPKKRIKKCLADFVPVDKMHIWTEKCRTAHDQLTVKIAHVHEQIAAIQTSTESECNINPPISLTYLETLLSSADDTITKLESKCNVIERDLSRVETLLSDLETRSKKDVNEKLLAVERLATIHVSEYLPEMHTLSTTLHKLLTKTFIPSKKTLTQHLLLSLLRIVAIQSTIMRHFSGPSDMEASFHVGSGEDGSQDQPKATATLPPCDLEELKGQLKSLKSAFLQIFHVQRMPSAWVAGVAEIVRRRNVTDFFVAKTRQLAESLTKIRSMEEQKRAYFAKDVALFLPDGVVKGLDALPPVFEVSIRGVESAISELPNYTKEDIHELELAISALRATALSSSSSKSTIYPESLRKLDNLLPKIQSMTDEASYEKEWHHLFTPMDGHAAHLSPTQHVRLWGASREDLGVQDGISGDGMSDVGSVASGLNLHGRRNEDALVMDQKIRELQERLEVVERERNVYREQVRDLLAEVGKE